MIYGLPSEISFSQSLLGLRAPNWKTGNARQCSLVESEYSLADTRIQCAADACCTAWEPLGLPSFNGEERSLPFKTTSRNRKEIGNVCWDHAGPEASWVSSNLAWGGPHSCCSTFAKALSECFMENSLDSYSVSSSECTHLPYGAPDKNISKWHAIIHMEHSQIQSTLSRKMEVVNLGFWLVSIKVSLSLTKKQHKGCF